MPMRTPAALVAAAIIASVGPAVAAADIDAEATIDCVVAESRALSSLGDYADGSKTGAINNWFANWVLSDEDQLDGLRVQLRWMPRTADGPQLAISTNDTVHNLIRVLSRTDESVIAVTSASDRLTAESWLFTVNFPRRAVMATVVQSNVAGVKGQVVDFACRFARRAPALDAPDAGDGFG